MDKINYRFFFKVVLFFSILINPSAIYTQTISGSVIDEDKTPLEFASVVLYSLPDSMELSVTDKIWELITTIVRDLAESFSMEEEQLLEVIINNNEMCQWLRVGFNYKQVG